VTRVTMLHLPIPEELWQHIVWLAAQAGMPADEWLCRAAIAQGALDPTLQERLEGELADAVAHARKHPPRDLTPAWLSGGVGMLPVETVAPMPARVTLKNYHRRGPHESGGFRASVYLDGRRIGTVSKASSSAPNHYEFLDPADGEEFFAHARAWGESKGVETHPDDDLLDELSLQLDDAVEARAMLRAGAIAVIALESSPVWLPGNTSTEPNHYEDHGLIPVEPGETPEGIAADHACSRWRVVASADRAEHRTSWRGPPRRRRERLDSETLTRGAHTARGSRQTK
jgi:hypothetical protein